MSYYTSGTISVTAGQTTVAAHLATFVTQARPGDLLIAGGTAAVIASVSSQTQLELAAPWAGTTLVDSAAYLIVHVSEDWSSNVLFNETAVAVLQRIEAGLPFQPDAYGSLAGRAAYDDAAVPFIYLQTPATAGAPFLVYVKQSGAHADWSIGASLKGLDGSDGNPGVDGTDGTDGIDGWSPVLAAAADGARRVMRIIDWQGGTGSKPATLGYLGAAGPTAVLADAIDFRGVQGIQGIQGDQGIQGIQGNAGWSPVTAAAADGARRVMRVVDWTGGVGTKPTATGYLGPAGLTAVLADAIDFRGVQGIQGDQGIQGVQGDKGWSPIVAAAADGARRVMAVVDWTGGAGAKPTATGYLGAAGLTTVLADALDFRGVQGIQGIQGEQGIQGNPGTPLEIRGNDATSMLQWRLVGGATWVDLVSYSAIQAATAHDYAPDIAAAQAQAMALAFFF